MGTLNYPRHSLFLGCCSLALFLVALFPSLSIGDRFFFLFGLSGALHAFAVVLALQSKASVLWRFAFVAAAASLSIAAPFGGLVLLDIFGLEDAVTALFVALALTSAIGAVFYWFLVRLVWVRSLPAHNLLVTVGFCVLASLFASFPIKVVPSLRDALLPIFWWFAFSGSLSISDRNNRRSNESRKSTA